jgi:hypothetical protein
MKKMFIIFTIAIFVIVIHLRFGSNIHDIYKENWNISIPNPTKYISPIEHVGAGDILVFDIMHYEDEDIRYLISKKEFSRIDFELERFYNNEVRKNFFYYLNGEELKKFNFYFDKEKIFNEDNFYVILEKNTESRYNFNLLIVDVGDNILYSIHSNYGDRT